MAQNLYLFTGENHYELREELKRRKDNFAQKFGADSIFTYHTENRNPGEIKQNLCGGGLFITKKLIILQGIPLDTTTTNKLKEEQYSKLTEEMIATTIGVPSDTILICVSYTPDKRGRFYKRITKEGQIKEFRPLDKNGLKLFVKQQLKDIEIVSPALETFLKKV
jgi:DNA polymerase III delta subunit